jgi:hypothetical protein
MSQSRRLFLLSLSAFASPVVLPNTSTAEEPQNRLTQPVFRVARSEPTGPAHPLDQALKIAEDGLVQMRANVNDYTATLCKRERVGTVVGEMEYMFVKIRNQKLENGQITVPFSVYLTFLKPAETKGREVIYVQGKNENKMVAHEGGVKGRFLPTVWLDPTGMLAMRGNRYPIFQLGLENLIVQLIERGSRDRQHADIQVEFRKDAKINNRTCTVIVIRHPEFRPGMDFHLAQVFIDDELNIPIRYVAYDWPKDGQQTGDVIEEYTYLNIQLNVGLTDADFDPENKNYNF